MSQAGSGDGSDLPGDMLEDGSREIDQGPPGSVGNRCIDDWACDMDLVCSVSRYCQPFLSDLPPQIVQAVPTPDSAHIPASAPIMFFADGTGFAVTFSVTAYTLEDTIDITDDVSLVTLTSGAGKDVYVLAPRSGYPLGASIVVTFSGDLVGSAVFNVDHDAPPFAEGQLDFEGDPNPELECTSSVGATSLPIGWTGFGDVGVISEIGSIVPTSGTNAMVMTTGAALCGTALSETSSMIVSGPIRGLGDSPSLTFDYNFQSSEFDDYCQTDYDDTLLAVLSGPEGAVATVVDSVNLVCDEGTHVDAEFPTMPDAGDSIYKETGNTVFGLEGPVGSPAVLAFVLTDVQDADLSSLVSIDNIVDTN